MSRPKPSTSDNNSRTRLPVICVHPTVAKHLSKIRATKLCTWSEAIEELYYEFRRTEQQLQSTRQLLGNNP